MVDPARAVSAMMAVTCPGRSVPRPGSAGVVVAYRRVSHHPRAPSGRLIKKIDRHPTVAISSPPISGPAARVAAPPAVHTLTARARPAASG